MNKVITRIAAQYDRLATNCPDRKKAFGIVYNRTEVGGVLLSQHPAGKNVTAQVLEHLGYEPFAFDNSPKTVTGNLDDFLS